MPGERWGQRPRTCEVRCAVSFAGNLCAMSRPALDRSPCLSSSAPTAPRIPAWGIRPRLPVPPGLALKGLSTGRTSRSCVQRLCGAPTGHDHSTPPYPGRRYAVPWAGMRPRPQRSGAQPSSMGNVYYILRDIWFRMLGDPPQMDRVYRFAAPIAPGNQP
jgi:hypothetical protein